MHLPTSDVFVIRRELAQSSLWACSGSLLLSPQDHRDRQGPRYAVATRLLYLSSPSFVAAVLVSTCGLLVTYFLR